MVGKWSLKPDKELMDYLEKNGNERGLIFEPSKDTTPKPNEAGACKTINAAGYLKAFNGWNERKDKLWHGGIDVPKAYEMTGECSPFPKTEMEIQALLDLIPEKSVNHAGVFISYIVNEVYQYDAIELRTNKPIGHLGTRNSRKRWVIIGDVGDDAGCDMKGGELLVAGNAGNALGICMKGGKIIVNGNAGRFVGAARYGGEIHLCGTYESIYAEKEGAVYHEGTLIA